MNNRFNIGRLCAVLTKEIRESWQTLLLTWVSLVGILTLVSLFVAYFNQSADQKWFDRIVTGSVGQAMAICIYLFSAISACAVFRMMRNKTMRLQALMLPASQAEKFAAAWIIAVPVFYITFAAGVFVSQLLAAAIFPLISSTGLAYPLVNWLCHDGEILGISQSAYAVASLLFTQSFFLLGGIVWAKNPLIKTFASLFAIGIIYLLCCGWAEIMTLRDEQFLVRNPDFELWHLDSIATAIMAVFTLFNYSLAYLRQREAEIINRW